MSRAFGWAVGALVALAGCTPVPEPSSAPAPGKTSEPTRDPQPGPEIPLMPVMNSIPDPQKKTEFGTGGADAKVPAIKFDGERAVKYLKQLCDIGPRISGTEGMKKQQELIEAHFKKLGATVTRQVFKARQNSRKEATEFCNLIVSWHPNKERRIVLCSHYDTRPIADQEANTANWNKPFLSANDGASGVAFMMELGNHMGDLKSEFGIDFVFFDGEEYIFETNRVGGGDRYFIGSEYFAEDYMKTKGKRKFRYEAGLLFDLFAAKGAELKVELYSLEYAKPLVEQVWGVAKELGVKTFKFERGWEVLDDHIALNKAGIPTIDIIDFDYPHWHKLSDTPDKVDAGQLADVAKVITTWLQLIK